jgi:hypothetical protein
MIPSMFRSKVPFVIALAMTAALILLPSCRRHSANEKRYDLKGKVVSIEKDKRLVTISHEDTWVTCPMACLHGQGGLCARDSGAGRRGAGHPVVDGPSS